MFDVFFINLFTRLYVQTKQNQDPLRRLNSNDDGKWQQKEALTGRWFRMAVQSGQSGCMCRIHRRKKQVGTIQSGDRALKRAIQGHSKDYLGQNIRGYKYHDLPRRRCSCFLQFFMPEGLTDLNPPDIRWRHKTRNRAFLFKILGSSFLLTTCPDSRRVHLAICTVFHAESGSTVRIAQFLHPEGEVKKHKLIRTPNSQCKIS